MNECETCWYYDYDEEYDEYYCMQDLDEDEYYRIMTSKSQHCPYYRYHRSAADIRTRQEQCRGISDRTSGRRRLYNRDTV